MIQLKRRFCCRRSLVLIIIMTMTMLLANRQCDAFTLRNTIRQLCDTSTTSRSPVSSARTRTLSTGASVSLVPLSLAKQRPSTKTKDNNTIKNKKSRNFKSPEDGSPLGVATVIIGFGILQLVGDNFDNTTTVFKQYAAPIIFCSASIVAGISRLVRNSKNWKANE